MDEAHLAASARSEATIRRARPEEAQALSDLSFRSKAYWGYDAAFMEACRDDLTVTATEILDQPVYVMAERQLIIGLYELRAASADEVVLHSLFIEPETIGHGYGKRLWLHAVDIARRLGFRSLSLHSEPHAEGFYRAMGAVREGEVPSTVIPGRLLPLMRFSLGECKVQP